MGTTLNTCHQENKERKGQALHEKFKFRKASLRRQHKLTLGAGESLSYESLCGNSILRSGGTVEYRGASLQSRSFKHLPLSVLSLFLLFAFESYHLGPFDF